MRDAQTVARTGVPLGESTIGPAELQFGGALTGVIRRWKPTRSIDSGTPGSSGPGKCDIEDAGSGVSAGRVGAAD